MVYKTGKADDICRGQAMKYLVVLLFVLAAWTIFDQLVLKSRDAGQRRPVMQELRELGSNFHVMAGILAALVIIIFLLRLMYHGLTMQ
jgi:hypothetical protein